MDTPTAITTLQSMVTSLQSNITGYQAQIDAITVAIQQLQGVLNTEQTDINEAVQAAEATPPISEPASS